MYISYVGGHIHLHENGIFGRGSCGISGCCGCFGLAAKVPKQGGQGPSTDLEIALVTWPVDEVVVTKWFL